MNLDKGNELVQTIETLWGSRCIKKWLVCSSVAGLVVQSVNWLGSNKVAGIGKLTPRWYPGSWAGPLHSKPSHRVVRNQGTRVIWKMECDQAA
jgi:hypothetical protein